ncbi:MAG TPA: hypothetical protein PKW84_02580 [Fervidobacterium sp.]|nr:hypothetical protein [Fervidobacterium sp.]HQQ17174.1 hypothetical protein [Fervidobacterium sp.]
MKRRVIFVLSMLLTVIFLSSSVVAQTSTSKSSSNASNTVDSSNSSTGISVFGFIEKIAGQRDFFISTKLTFDMIDGAERKVFTVSFDMQIDNLEDFVFYLKGPEILKGIIIEYNMVTGKVDYTYDNSKASQSLVSDVNQISGIIQSITDFLSTPMFDTKEVKGGVEFRPKNSQILTRFGVQPIVVSLSMSNNVPTKIEIGNDKTDEKVTLEFPKFVIGG